MWNAHDYPHGWGRRGWHFMPLMPFVALFIFIVLFKVAWWLPVMLIAIFWSGAAGSCGHHGGKRKRGDRFARPDDGWYGGEEKEKRKRGEDEYI